ncbi:MAG: polyprenyl synthetase family protein [Actinobacteria bacterium]|nr:polyprenyl synthetase family protein [Actinomycetota bacterium]
MSAKYPEGTRLFVEDRLKRYFPEMRYPEVIYQAMHHSLFSGGKRFRGVLVVEAARTLGQEPDYVGATACAVEYIHTYSLIHDDLPSIDNDDLRRGQPTCHVVFGEDIAILAGDALYSEAFNIISSEQKADDPSKIIQVIRELAAASGAAGMVGGQVVDLMSEGKEINTRTLEFIHEKKTGELIRASVRAGAILAGASLRELELLTAYAKCLGLAFQITDDVLDVIGDTAVLGKATGSDESRGKATYPGLFGIEGAKEMAKTMTDRAKDVLRELNGDGRVLADLADFVYEREL